MSPVVSGHAVLAVPVPALDDVVRAHTAHHDASFVSADPAFSHAHVTVLAPWLAEPTDDDLTVVRDVVADEPAFAVAFREVAQFADGITYLVPEPAAPFSRLTARLAAAFPRTPPYGGRYDTLVPHLTLDHRLTGATVASVTAALGDRLPVVEQVTCVDLQWWANHDCHVRARFPLGVA
jgi:hypothetical protein